MMVGNMGSKRIDCIESYSPFFPLHLSRWVERITSRPNLHVVMLHAVPRNFLLSGVKEISIVERL